MPTYYLAIFFWPKLHKMKEFAPMVCVCGGGGGGTRDLRIKVWRYIFAEKRPAVIVLTSRLTRRRNTRTSGKDFFFWFNVFLFL